MGHKLSWLILSLALQTSFAFFPTLSSKDAAVCYLPSTTNSEVFPLNTGVNMTVDHVLTGSLPDKPPLLFLHGSFHGSWCWEENFFPYFQSKGYPVMAINWRGTGGTPAGPQVRKVKITESVHDLDCFLKQVLPKLTGRNNIKQKPVVVAHSFGGVALLKFLETVPDSCDSFSSLALFCSVPPSGNGKMTRRYLRRSFQLSWKILAGFAMKKCLTNEALCRELFFGQDSTVTMNDIRRYQDLFTRDSQATCDIAHLSKNLPSASAINGVASFANDLPTRVVVGATNDVIVDCEGLEETAKFLGLDQVVMVESAHDVMLGSNWTHAAEVLLTWIESSAIKGL